MNFKYKTICKTCGKEILGHYPKKYCNRKCYFSNEETLNRLNLQSIIGREHRKIKPFVMNNGYKMIYKPEHPFARHGKGQYVYEHRLVMEEKLGRYLDPTKEIIHHINGNPTDNRIENLVLTTRQEHMKNHMDILLRNIKLASETTKISKEKIMESLNIFFQNINTNPTKRDYIKYSKKNNLPSFSTITRGTSWLKIKQMFGYCEIKYHPTKEFAQYMQKLSIKHRCK